MLTVSRIDHAIGSRLRDKRIQKGVDAQGFCASLGITLEQLSEFECGQVRVDAGSLRKICHLLDCSIKYFFEPLFNDVTEPPGESRHAVAAE